MSMSTTVVGIRPPTDDYKKKVAAYLACEAADITPPEELITYFDGVDAEHIDPNGMAVDLHNHPSVTKYRGESTSGLDVDLRALPAGVTILRFYNGW
jgi:hypothetical protein